MSTVYIVVNKGQVTNAMSYTRGVIVKVIDLDCCEEPDEFENQTNKIKELTRNDDVYRCSLEQQ